MTEELKKKLNKIVENKDSEAVLAACASVNVQVPQQLQGELIELLKLESDQNELLEELFKLEPKELVTLLTLALMSKGRVCDFIRGERNFIVLKLSTIDHIKNNPNYRETSVDENDGNPKAMLKALILMQQTMFEDEEDNK